jgi:hypothetical protein
VITPANTPWTERLAGELRFHAGCRVEMRLERPARFGWVVGTLVRVSPTGTFVEMRTHELGDARDENVSGDFRHASLAHIPIGCISDFRLVRKRTAPQWRLPL